MAVIIISAEGFEDLELFAPLYRLREAAVEVEIASLVAGPFRGKHGYQVQARLPVKEVRVDDFALLLLPGGGAPAALREDPQVQRVAEEFFERGRPVGAICHGPQILVSAGLLRGRAATCYPGIADELREAGAVYRDEPLVEDGNLFTSRRPDDLPRFDAEMMRRLAA